MHISTKAPLSLQTEPQDGNTEKWRKVNFLDRNPTTIHRHHCGSTIYTDFFFFLVSFERSEFERKLLSFRLATGFFLWPVSVKVAVLQIRVHLLNKCILIDLAGSCLNCWLLAIGEGYSRVNYARKWCKRVTFWVIRKRKRVTPVWLTVLVKEEERNDFCPSDFLTLSNVMIV